MSKTKTKRRRRPKAKRASKKEAPPDETTAPPAPSVPPTTQELLEYLDGIEQAGLVKTVAGLVNSANAGTITPEDLGRLDGLRARLEAMQAAQEPPEAAPADTVPTANELAAALGVTTRTIRNWRRLGMPTHADGYSVGDVRAWRDNLDAPGGHAPNLKAQLLQANTEYRAAKARLAEMELAVQRGELVPRSEIEALTVAKIHAAKRILLVIPRKLAHVLDPETTQLLQREIEDALNRLAGK